MSLQPYCMGMDCMCNGHCIAQAPATPRGNDAASPEVHVRVNGDGTLTKSIDFSKDQQPATTNVQGSPNAQDGVNALLSECLAVATLPVDLRVRIESALAHPVPSVAPITDAEIGEVLKCRGMRNVAERAFAIGVSRHHKPAIGQAEPDHWPMPFAPSAKRSEEELDQRVQFESWHRTRFPDVEFKLLMGAYGVTSPTPRGSTSMNARWEGWVGATARTEVAYGELVQLRAQNMLLVGLYDAVASLVSAAGRERQDQNYLQVVAAYDQVRTADGDENEVGASRT